MRLKDRVAIVTGGSSGIGRGICIEFAKEGASVVVADVQEEPKIGKWHDTDLETTTVEEVEKLNAAATFIRADMGKEDEVQAMMDTVGTHFGGLDIVVNNAGVHIPGNSQELSVADWDSVMGVNLRGFFIAVKYAIPHLRRSKVGRIINIASVHAFRGGGGPVYPAAKAGVVNLTRDTAIEVAVDNITVNAICPGYIETPIQDYLTKEDIAGALSHTPLPRFGTPKDIGRACVFFASDDAAWITGTALPVDGGWLAPIV